MAVVNYGGTEPSKLLFMPLPDGTADVWLRKNIRSAENVEGDETVTSWEAEETYINTSMSHDEVLADFDNLFDNGLPRDVVEPSETERLSALERTMSKQQSTTADLSLVIDDLLTNIIPTLVGESEEV